MTKKEKYTILIVGSLTLGLAPFVPQPHLFEKLGMLFNGTLFRPIDIFDLALHAFFPLLLIYTILSDLFFKSKNSDKNKKKI